MAVLRQIDQLKQWSSQLKAMADQLTQLKDTHKVLSHVTSLAGANGALGGFTRQAGPSSSKLPRLMNGRHEWGTANTRLQRGPAVRAEPIRTNGPPRWSAASG